MVNITKRASPMIGKLSELLVTGHRSGLLDVGTSPRTPLELRIQSPRGLKNYDLGGVGLGIVAALEKSGDYNSCGIAKYAVANSKLNRSNPIPVNLVKKNGDRFIAPDFDEDEEYTYVTCHRPNNNSYTKVYYDGGQIGSAKRNTAHKNRSDLGIFNITTTSYVEDSCLYPPSDFLSCCDLCNKKLHGKDIFMYRGEKAFCSSECRSSQILMDERKEQLRTKTSRSGIEHVSSSSYSRGQIFLTGIVAV